MEDVAARTRSFLARLFVSAAAAALTVASAKSLAEGSYTSIIGCWAIAGPIVGALVAYYFWASSEGHSMNTLSMASGFLRDGASDQPRDMAKTPKKNRVQLDFAPRAMERLNAKTEASSYAEVVKNALRLYEALIEETESGRQFLIKDETGAVAPFRLFL